MWFVGAWFLRFVFEWVCDVRHMFSLCVFVVVRDACGSVGCLHVVRWFYV